MSKEYVGERRSIMVIFVGNLYTLAAAGDKEERSKQMREVESSITRRLICF